ncbi:MAG: 30S ribosomal protein S1 [bacterium]
MNDRTQSSSTDEKVSTVKTFAELMDGIDDFESLSAESMEDVYASTFQIKDGEIVNGTIVGFESDFILVDVGYKSEGLVPRLEFPSRGSELNIGDPVEVFVENCEDEDGVLVLSKEKANRIKIWDELTLAYEKEENIMGRVTARIKGGLTVDVGLKAFLPGSQVDLRPVRDLDQFIGKQLELKIIKLSRKRGNIVLSRRILLEDERAEMKRETLKTIQEGQQAVGIVKNITDYGAFIDLGGIDGLLHITDMSWGRVNHPSEVVSLGDTIKVLILNYDKEKERVSLGHKQITPDPWDSVKIKYPTNGRVRGRVVSITDYGVFLELEHGIEGLVHVSEMSWTRRVRHPSKIVSMNDIIDAVVLDVQVDSRRISLGMKQIEKNPWDNVHDRFSVGTQVKGQVRNLTEFGAFVSLEDGIDGLIHISDISWTQRFKHPSEILDKGQEVEAVVLSIDTEKERLSLGMKQLSSDPWVDIEKKYSVGDNIKAEITKITNFGVFASPEAELEGLVHISELSEEKINKPEEIVRVGDVFNMRVVKIEADQRRLGLSIKEYIEATGEDALISQAPIKEEIVEETKEEVSELKSEVTEDTAKEDSSSDENKQK